MAPAEEPFELDRVADAWEQLRIDVRRPDEQSGAVRSGRLTDDQQLLALSHGVLNRHRYLGGEIGEFGRPRRGDFEQLRRRSRLPPRRRQGLGLLTWLAMVDRAVELGAELDAFAR